jgi:hypothetical protein
MRDTIWGPRQIQSSLPYIPAYFNAYRPQGCRLSLIRCLRRPILAVAGRVLVLAAGRLQPF